jgi:hypothetical protein
MFRSICAVLIAILAATSIHAAENPNVVLILTAVRTS